MPENLATVVPPALDPPHVRFLRTLARMTAERFGAMASWCWALSETDHPYPGTHER